MRCTDGSSSTRANIEDFVILRSDGHPTYHLSVVVDDVEMAITDVIRGDDHISNTPKHVLLFEALGAPVPRFAHVPLILGADKKRLSKRHGATSVMEYQRQGYLPDAMVNFLALLGWSPGDDRELMTRGRADRELRARRHQRRQRRVQHREARLDERAVHRRGCRSTSSPAPCGRCSTRRGSMTRSRRDQRRLRSHRLLELLRPRAKRLTDFVEQAGRCSRERSSTSRRRSRSICRLPGLARHIGRAGGRACAAVEPFRRATCGSGGARTAAERGIKAGALIHATRVAVTGRTRVRAVRGAGAARPRAHARASRSVSTHFSRDRAICSESCICHIRLSNDSPELNSAVTRSSAILLGIPSP